MNVKERGEMTKKTGGMGCGRKGAKDKHTETRERQT